MLIFAVCACVVAGVLRQYSPGFAVVFSLGCAALFLLRGLALAQPVLELLNELNSQLNLRSSVLMMVKRAGSLPN